MDTGNVRWVRAVCVVGARPNFMKIGPVMDSLEERLDLRLARIDDRFTTLEERFTERFARVDDRFTASGHHVSAAVSGLRATIEHEMREQTIRFGQELRSQTNTTVFALAGVVLTMAALAFALVRFT